MTNFKKTWALLLLSVPAGLSVSSQSQSNLNAVEIAKKHNIVYNKSAPDFFEGALLGNGAMGVVVTTRPDAVILRFGHNNVWDIRLAENNREKLGTFQEVFNKVKQIPSSLANLTDDPWYNEYNRMAGENYSKPYPRPFPCGSVLLGFDRREIEVLGHELDISNGLCMVKLLTSAKKKLLLKVFTDMKKDQLWMELTDENGNGYPNIFNRIKLIPDPSTPSEFPIYQVTEKLQEGIISFRQTLPHQEPEKYKIAPVHPKDKAFRLTLQVSNALSKQARTNWNGNMENMAQLEAALSKEENFLACVSIEEGLDSKVDKILSARKSPLLTDLKASFSNNTKIWNEYWAKSAIELSDNFLEEIWYRNLYFFNCASKEGTTTPGLFANWSYNNIGTAWHGDYHMNYNTQQPYWMTFSSNHLEKNLPYVDLIEKLMPVSRKWANDYYGLPGAYFPHSAFPVEMTMNPYPIPDWGWEVSETPWAVQGLWWHYLYSGDKSFLKNRAYEPIKAAVEFLVAYMKRNEAHGGERWKDNKYHIFPSVPPELYGLRPGFKYNYDSSVDLTLTKFIFKAFAQAAKILKTEKADIILLKDIEEILSNYPDYSTAENAKGEKVFVSVPGEHAQVVYNVPNALITAFPGEDNGLHSDSATLNILRNTYLNQQNEGGNDLVFINLQAARIGMLDIENFKRHVNYSLLPNGTATDMVTQTGGRYNDNSDFSYMSKMGIWFENFALPAVINECLMQSYNGTIRLFPNWPAEKDATFNQLRAAGAFLVSATLSGGKVTSVTIWSERGSDLQLEIPKSLEGGFIETGKGKKRIGSGIMKMKTTVGETLKIYPQSR